MNTTIPLKNLYYLLCYAWDSVEGKDLVSVEDTLGPGVQDLFAKVLVEGTHRAIRRGLNREYQERREVLSVVRGKLVLTPTLQKGLLQKGQAVFEFEELDANIDFHKILKKTFRVLLNTQDLDPGISKDCLALFQRFRRIDDIPLDLGIFSKLIYHRNTQHYRLLMNVCKWIWTLSLPSEEEGKYQCLDFWNDDEKMEVIYENFIRNFYRHEQNIFHVRSQWIKWDFEPASEQAEMNDFLPSMKTDITLSPISEERETIVIDAKFYSKTLMDSWYDKGSKKIHPANLFQIRAYMQNLSVEGYGPLRGILLYPTVDVSLDLSYESPLGIVEVKTLNLNQDWQQIHCRLLEIIEEAQFRNKD